MLQLPFDGSIGLIRKSEPGRSLWLAHWEERQQEFQFVVARRLQKESYRECLSREIAWSLHLERDRDYLISSVARLHYEVSQCTVEFYVVDPYGKQAAIKLDADPANVWLNRSELQLRQTDDGRPISNSLCELLFQADVLPHDIPAE